MMKAIKYGLIVFGGVLILYNSVYFKKLDEVKAVAAAGEFDAAGYAQDLWDNKLPEILDNSVNANILFDLIGSDPDTAFSIYSKALGIGNIRYFLITGDAEIISIGEDQINLKLIGASAPKKLFVPAQFVFGNAIRDASGLVDINDFINTMDFNDVSSELNKIVQSQVLPPLLRDSQEGKYIHFIGAIELNRQYPDLSNIELIPISVKLLNEDS